MIVAFKIYPLSQPSAKISAISQLSVNYGSVNLSLASARVFAVFYGINGDPLISRTVLSTDPVISEELSSDPNLFRDFTLFCLSSSDDLTTSRHNL